MIGKLLPAPGTPRVLMFATLVNTVGNGAYLATAALFLTRSVGLTPGTGGAGPERGRVRRDRAERADGLAGRPAGPEAGADRGAAGAGGCFAGLTRVHHLWSYALVACVIAVGDATVKAATGAMIAGRGAAGGAGPHPRVHPLDQQRRHRARHGRRRGRRSCSTAEPATWRCCSATRRRTCSRPWWPVAPGGRHAGGAPGGRSPAGRAEGPPVRGVRVARRPGGIPLQRTAQRWRCRCGW